MFGHLHIEERGRPARVVDLLGTATIGRTAENDIVLDSDGVSHCHAMLLAQPSGVDLVDLGSTFGTFINAIPAPPDEPVRLADGAQISIGRAALRYLAPRITASIAPLDAARAAPPLAVLHLNTRFLGLDAATPLVAGRHTTLLVWVGAPLPTDEQQSSRPFKLAGTPLATTMALRVRVRAASPFWHVIADQPMLLAERWGSAQIARFEIAARQAERTRLAVRIEQATSGALLQQIVLGMIAHEPNPRQPGRTPLRNRLPGEPLAQVLPICRRCFAPTRAGARFCHHCGAQQ